jgi:predicted metal-dependent peptidase
MSNVMYAEVVRDKEERRLKKAKVTLMREPKFALWSGILMLGKTEVVDDVPTACTNGRDERYGRKFITSVDDKELAFVVLHENLHKAFKHLTTWRKLYEEDGELANEACDYVINLMLVKMDPFEEHISPPRRDGKVYALIDRRFDKMNAKQVFDILKQEKEKEKEKEENGGEGKGPKKEGGGFDSHDWDGAKELSKEEQGELEREIDQGLRQGLAAAKKAGLGAGDMEREIGDMLTPKVDWREQLREYVKAICSSKDTSSWRRVNRRFISSDIYMPTMVGEKVGHIVVAIDTSGSIGGDVITRFLTEVKAIADEVHPEKIDLLYWDTVVAGHEEYDASNMDSLVQSTKPRGGGGTDPRCVMNYSNNRNMKPECIVVLTDGEVGDNWGTEWSAPVLWVITNTRNITAPVGKSICIEE